MFLEIRQRREEGKILLKRNRVLFKDTNKKIQGYKQIKKLQFINHQYIENFNLGIVCNLCPFNLSLFILFSF